MNTKQIAVISIFLFNLVPSFGYSQSAQNGEGRPPRLEDLDDKTKAALEACMKQNPMPDRKKGERPTEEQRAQFDKVRTAFEACLKEKGVQAPPRPPHHRGGSLDQPPAPPSQESSDGSSGTTRNDQIQNLQKDIASLREALLKKDEADKRMLAKFKDRNDEDEDLDEPRARNRSRLSTRTEAQGINPSMLMGLAQMAMPQTMNSSGFFGANMGNMNMMAGQMPGMLAQANYMSGSLGTLPNWMSYSNPQTIYPQYPMNLYSRGLGTR